MKGSAFDNRVIAREIGDFPTFGSISDPASFFPEIPFQPPPAPQGALDDRAEVERLHKLLEEAGLSGDRVSMALK
jgi:hypothetical protein